MRKTAESALQVRLEHLAKHECWSDDEDFIVDNYACGNVDDAYYGGTRDGVTLLARELLKEFFSEQEDTKVEHE